MVLLSDRPMPTFLRRFFQRFSRNKFNSLRFVSTRDRPHVSAEEVMLILISWREVIRIFIRIARLPSRHPLDYTWLGGQRVHIISIYLFVCPRNYNEFLKVIEWFPILALISIQLLLCEHQDWQGCMSYPLWWIVQFTLGLTKIREATRHQYFSIVQYRCRVVWSCVIQVAGQSPSACGLIIVLCTACRVTIGCKRGVQDSTNQ